MLMLIYIRHLMLHSSGLQKMQRMALGCFWTITGAIEAIQEWAKEKLLMKYSLKILGLKQRLTLTIKDLGGPLY